MIKKYNITVNGSLYEVEVEELGGVESIAAPTAAAAPKAAPKAKPTAPKPSGGAGAVNAPMPGTILSVDVKVGDVVKAGDTLCILEAMKMENEIVAPVDATVKGVHVNKGDTVANGDLLITLE